MLKKVGLFISILLFFSLLSLYPQDNKVTVIADQAPIFTEASENSIQIDLIKKGAVLTLFEPWEGEKAWLYVTYTSAKWRAKVTGFVQSSLVMRGELSPEEVAREKTARPAAEIPKIKEKKATELEIEMDKLPSLKDVFRQRKKIEETKPEEKAPPKEEPTPEPLITESLGETEVLEAMTILPAEATAGQSDVYAFLEKPAPAEMRAVPPEPKIFEEFLPPAQEFTVPESSGISSGDFKREEVFPPAVEEAKAPEPVPVLTKVIFAESEIPVQRNIAAAPATEAVSRFFAVIKEEMPKPEVRRALAEAVAKEEKSELEVTPYEVVVAVPKTAQAEMKELKPAKTEKPSAEKATKKPEKEVFKKDKIEGEAKAEASPKTAPEEKAPPKPEKEIQPEKIPEIQEVPPVRQRKPPPELIKPKLPVKRVGLMTAGFGFGPSFGGFGASLQLNSKAGFSIHAGVGYYPATAYYSDFDWLQNRVLFSAGIKYYLPFGSDRLKPYLNLQYGGLSVEAVQVETGIWYGQKTYENIQKSLYGPSLLAGMEWRLGFLGLNGSLGLSYNTTDWEYWDRNLFLNGDLALIIYF